MRRKLALAFVVAVLATLLALFAFVRDEPAPADTSPAPAQAAAPSAPGPASLVDAASEPASTVARELAPNANAALAPASAHDDAPRCRVFGRLADADGRPVGGAVVRLYGYKSWAPDSGAQRLSGPFDFHGFETSTDGAGEFRLVVPEPAVERTLLTIEPDRHHDSHRIVFAPTGDGVVPPLARGDRDLGEIRVARTGAIVGRVLDESGTPLADVDMGIGSAPNLTFERNARTDARGEYVIAHAPAGTYGVRVKSLRHLAHFEPGVTVVAGADTRVKDLVLTPAPTIEGTVTGENGRPLAGVRLWGWPASTGGGSGAGAKSDAAGHFVVYLPQTDPITLSATLDGYEPWGDEHDDSKTFAPGTRDLAIVLRAQPNLRFRVVDAQSKAAIERFGFEIRRGEGSRAPRMIFGQRRTPPLVAHADGVVEASARPGVDGYLCAAEGYPLQSGDVEAPAAGATEQTIELLRGAEVRGRVLADGAPAVNAQVELAVSHDFRLPDEGPRYVDAERRRTTHTEADGRFTFVGIDAGEHRLTVRPVKGAPLIREHVVVHERATTDLGDIVLLAGATITGELLAPAGVDLTGLHVFLDGEREGVKTVVDHAGHFRFDDVPSGVRFVSHGDRPGVIASGKTVKLELAPGETRAITLDARDAALCHVSLRVELGDVPAEGLRVQLEATERRVRPAEVGKLDAAGHVSGAVPPLGAARVVVRLDDGRAVRHPGPALDVRPLGAVDALVRFEFAAVELRVRKALPREGKLRLRFSTRGSDEHAEFLELRIANGEVVARSALSSPSSGGVVVRGVLAGARTIRVDVVEASSEDPAARAGLLIDESAAYYSASADVDLAPGETRMVDL